MLSIFLQESRDCLWVSKELFAIQFDVMSHRSSMDKSKLKYLSYIRIIKDYSYFGSYFSAIITLTSLTSVSFIIS